MKKEDIIITVKDLTKDYTTGSVVDHALRGINLEIKKGEFTAILGNSGSGKSTLLNILGGNANLTSGKYFFQEKDMSKASVSTLNRFRREVVGFVFQRYNLMTDLTIKENISLACSLCKKKDNMSPEDALKRVGLLEKKNNYPSMLSGGQQQRVCIARAIAKHPQLILADEPTAALDETTGKEVLKQLLELVKEANSTLVLVTHNSEIAKLADRVIRLRDGKIDSIVENDVKLKLNEINW